MKINTQMHITELGKMSDQEVKEFQRMLPQTIVDLRAAGVRPINTSMNYKLSTIEDMARVADGHQASLLSDVPLLAATFRVAEKEKDFGVDLAKVFAWVVFVPDLGDHLVVSTSKGKSRSPGAHVRQSAKSHQFVDDAIARATKNTNPEV